MCVCCELRVLMVLISCVLLRLVDIVFAIQFGLNLIVIILIFKMRCMGDNNTLGNAVITVSCEVPNLPSCIPGGGLPWVCSKSDPACCELGRVGCLSISASCMGPMCCFGNAEVTFACLAIFRPCVT